jgi:hypothetical protein
MLSFINTFIATEWGGNALFFTVFSVGLGESRMVAT